MEREQIESKLKEIVVTSLDLEDITVEDIRSELAGRHVIDHKVKQEKMT